MKKALTFFLIFWLLVSVYAFPVVESATSTLRPNASGTYQQWSTFGSGSNHYDRTSDQDDLTGVQVTGSTTLKESLSLQDVSASGTITQVTAYIRAKATGSGGVEKAAILWRTYGTDYESAAITIGRTAFADYSETRTTNPYTGQAWTWDEINALEIGARATALGTGETIQVSEVWIVVTYTATYSGSGSQSVTISASASNSMEYSRNPSQQVTISSGSSTQVEGVEERGWLSGWLCRKSHMINSASGAGTGYQIMFKIYYGSGTDSGENIYLNGRCRSDFGDVRFTDDDGTTLLSYWMEYKEDENYAIFWVKVDDDLSSSSATICIYYGNPSATTTSNGFTTFLFFDDFESYASDSDINNQGGWVTKKVGTGGEAKVRAVNGTKYLHLDGGSTSTVVVHQLNIPNSVAFVACEYADDWNEAFEMAFGDGNIGTNGEVYNGYDIPWWGWAGATSKIRRWVSWSYTDLASISDSDSNYVFHILEFRWYGNSLKGFRDGVQKMSGTDSTYSSRSYIHLGEWFGSSRYVDWVFVRKYVEPEPSHGSTVTVHRRLPTASVSFSTSSAAEAITGFFAFATQAVSVNALASRELSAFSYAGQSVSFSASTATMLDAVRAAVQDIQVAFVSGWSGIFFRETSGEFSVSPTSGRVFEGFRSLIASVNFAGEVGRVADFVRGTASSVLITFSPERLGEFARSSSTSLSLSGVTERVTWFLRGVVTSASFSLEALRQADFARQVASAVSLASEGLRQTVVSRIAELLASFSVQGAAQAFYGLMREVSLAISTTFETAKQAAFSRAALINVQFSPDAVVQALLNFVRSATVAISVVGDAARSIDIIRAVSEGITFLIEGVGRFPYNIIVEVSQQIYVKAGYYPLSVYLPTFFALGVVLAVVVACVVWIWKS